MRRPAPIVILVLIALLGCSSGSGGDDPISGGVGGTDGGASSDGTAGGGDDEHPWVDDAGPGAQFRTNNDYFEIDRGDGEGWQPFYPRGVNLAVAVPGTWPGELAATFEDYQRWFDDIVAMNANVIRLYTLHRPWFYEAYADWKKKNPDKELWIVHGIWMDEIPYGEPCFSDETGAEIACEYITEMTEQLDEEIRYVIDAVHGDALIPARFGKAYGKFQTDISRHIMAWLPGHEMIAEHVVPVGTIYAQYTEYDGKYVRKTGGHPLETWVARGLDHTVLYDYERWGQMRPVGWSNWPALDAIHHPTETTAFGQDELDVNLADYTTAGPFNRGIYASYHVYPFNPEFIIYTPAYQQTVDAKGRVNAYLGYMLDLKAQHEGRPVFITEFGIPSSLGNAHANPWAWDHGGYNTAEQAEITVALYESVVEAGMGGAVIFEWLDEWFKRVWMTNPTTYSEHDRLWHDMTDPEENFGIVTYHPVAGEAHELDGDASEWDDDGKAVHSQDGAALRADAAPVQVLRGLQMDADPDWLHLRIETSAAAGADGTTLSDVVLYVGFDTVEGPYGDRRFPDVQHSGGPLKLATGLGLESVLVIDRGSETLEVRVDDKYGPGPTLSGQPGGSGVPTDDDNGVFEVQELLINNDLPYLAEAKEVIPDRQFYRQGVLRFGDSRIDSLASAKMASDGSLEVRVPWHTLWISDPAARRVVHDDPDTKNVFEFKTFDEIRVVVVAARRKADDSLEVTDVLPRAALAGDTLDAAKVPGYGWPTWEVEDLQYVEVKKPVYDALKEAFKEDPR